MTKTCHNKKAIKKLKEIRKVVDELIEINEDSEKKEANAW